MRMFWVVIVVGELSLGLAGIQGISQTSATNSAPAESNGAKQSALPDGPGKDVVERMCVGCHDMKTVTSKHQTQDEWAQTVDDMVSRGANGSDEDIDKVVKYLSAHFGPVKNGDAPAAADSPSPKS
jgi:hypothetical protein